MYSKLSIVALCAAASVQEVAAASLHRHMHPKRGIVYAETDTVVITDYVTVTVTAGEEGPTEAALPATSSIDFKGKGKGDSSEYPAAPVSSSSTSTSSSSSSSVVVVSTTVPAAEPTYPTSTPTTLIASVKVPSVPVVESIASSSSSEAVPNVLYPTTQAQSSAVATSTSAAAASSATTVTSSTSSTGKRGAAYNDASLVTDALNLGAKLSWAYNWGSDSGGLKADVAYYPMLWSSVSDYSSNWDSKAEAAISSGSDAFLSFNEPDIAAQSNLSPAQAAAGHQEFFGKYAGKVRIGSPAISSSENAGQGIDWLKQFLDACDGKCQIDFCVAHWYGPGGNAGAEQFLDHVTKVHEACNNKNVWITEFAANGGGDVDAFMSAITQKLDSDEYSFVEKYSYFMLSQGSLMNSPTELSSYGKIFAGTA
ncbi:glycoside hydrolase family 128 protein [Hypoxylon trugodes]|uniref:glycoside hydrolase family 128 protein n=1 Tax=Hypoxylon trugodes TaxID=326681 RepID=UPI00219AB7AF|nr:glycoside hydrolase family 128 protein [Hypoxylon trugodes]KAI1388769.1 glycoside hydrolase family 128 protein [Hypoxylon trugodes]